MSGITKQRYNQIQEAAMEMVASCGVRKIDAMKDKTTKYAIYNGWTDRLVAKFSITHQIAKRHIAKACRQQRHPNWVQ